MEQLERPWSHQETAAFLGVTPGTLYVWNSRNAGPRSYKIGHLRRYDPGEVRAWLQAKGSGTEVAHQ